MKDVHVFRPTGYNMKYVCTLLVVMLLLTACSAAIPEGQSSSPPSHAIWSDLLAKHVDNEGYVNYKGFIKDKDRFDKYLDLLSDTPPSAKWTKQQRIAYWINAYNAFTVKLIVMHYPVESIKDIGSAIQIPFVNTPWQFKFFSIGGEEMKLDEIEHKILRKQFDDPRVHFALVCASYSCPRLRNEAYTADNLDDQLNDQARNFLSNKKKNDITKNKLVLSKYFTWYKGDFTEKMSLIDYLNQYAPVTIDKDADISYKDYNWSLNEQ